MKTKKLPKNVVKISAAPKVKYVRRTVQSEDQTHALNTIRLRSDISTRDDANSVAFEDLPITSYFLYDYGLDVGSGDTCSGIFMKVSKKKAILILDAYDANIPMFEDEEYGQVGSTYKFDIELVFPVNSELHLS